MVNRSYTKVPNNTINLVSLPLSYHQGATTFAENYAQCHKDAKKRTEQANLRYKAAADAHCRHKTYKEGDLVMVYLRKRTFPSWYLW